MFIFNSTYYICTYMTWYIDTCSRRCIGVLKVSTLLSDSVRHTQHAFEGGWGSYRIITGNPRPTGHDSTQIWISNSLRLHGIHVDRLHVSTWQLQMNESELVSLMMWSHLCWDLIRSMQIQTEFMLYNDFT